MENLCERGLNVDASEVFCIHLHGLRIESRSPQCTFAVTPYKTLLRESLKMDECSTQSIHPSLLYPIIPQASVPGSSL